MATAAAAQIEALQTECQHQRQLLNRLGAQVKQQQRVLDVQFRRIADIQAELDLVKAAVRRAAPAFAAAFIGPQPSAAATMSSMVIGSGSQLGVLNGTILSRHAGQKSEASWPPR